MVSVDCVSTNRTKHSVMGALGGERWACGTKNEKKPRPCCCLCRPNGRPLCFRPWLAHKTTTDGSGTRYATSGLWITDFGRITRPGTIISSRRSWLMWLLFTTQPLSSHTSSARHTSPGGQSLINNILFPKRNIPNKIINVGYNCCTNFTALPKY